MSISLTLVASVLSVLQVPTNEPGASALRRLRSSDASVLATIQEGCRRSPTFAALVNFVERSSFVVYVEQVATLRDGMRGALLHGGAGPMYLRVLLKRGMSRDRRVVVLAHELQHVREVVEAGITADASKMDELFQRIGHKRGALGQRQQYETSSAVQVSNVVTTELRARDVVRIGGHSCSSGTP